MMLPLVNYTANCYLICGNMTCYDMLLSTVRKTSTSCDKKIFFMGTH